MVNTTQQQLVPPPIPVHVRFLKITSPAVNSSRFACNKTNEEIAEALDFAKRVWFTQAGILLQITIEEQSVTAEVDQQFERHLEYYSNPKISFMPKHLWVNLRKIIGYPAVTSAWEKNNEVTVCCIGAFAGNNAVAIDRLIFIRTLEYRAEDVFMDNLRFARVIAHELGHSFHLGHPRQPQCISSCRRGECRLMCQQMAIPEPHDPRLALSLIVREVSFTRGIAANFAVRSTSNNATDMVVGLYPFDQVSTKGSGKCRLVMFPQALQHDINATLLRFQLSRFGGSPIQVGLVSMNRNHTVKLLAWNWFGGMANSSKSSDDSFARLVFSQVDFTWWTPRRHVEAEIHPAVHLTKGETWGMMFSISSVGVALVKDKEESVRIATTHIPDFSIVLEQESFVLNFVNDSVAVGFVPKMNLKGT